MSGWITFLRILEPGAAVQMGQCRRGGVARFFQRQLKQAEKRRRLNRFPDTPHHAP